MLRAMSSAPVNERAGSHQSSIPRRSDSGTSLPVPLQRDMQSAFRHDFAEVRVHIDRQAARQAEAVGARAFTRGSDIFFAPGEYSPWSPPGKRLIAHELTHVVQQKGNGPSSREAIEPPASPAESLASAVAERVIHGRGAGTIPAGSTSAIQRQPDPTDPGVQPAPVQAWSPATRGVFSISVESSLVRPDGAFGGSSNGVGHFPLSNRGRIQHFCSTPAHYPLQVRFYVDSVQTPRPQPFRPPVVSVAMEFTPSSGAAQRVTNAADSAPRYLGPGWPLVPSFGEHFAASSSQSGLMTVQANLNDPDTGTSLAYRDSVPCELVTCA